MSSRISNRHRETARTGLAQARTQLRDYTPDRILPTTHGPQATFTYIDEHHVHENEDQYTAFAQPQLNDRGDDELEEDRWNLRADLA